MAWSLNAGSIAAGQSVRWWLSWPSWPGPELIVARALPTRTSDLEVTAPAELVVTDVSVKLELNGGYTYALSVTNRGPWGVPYELVGNAV